MRLRPQRWAPEIPAENLTARLPPYLGRQLDYRVLPQKSCGIKRSPTVREETFLRQFADDETSSVRICISADLIDERRTLRVVNGLMVFFFLGGGRQLRTYVPA